MNRTAMILFPLFRLAHSEVAERIRDFDWTSTDTGPISDWLNDVQTAVTICADIASAQQVEFPALEVYTRRAAAGSLASARSHRSMTALKATAADPSEQAMRRPPQRVIAGCQRRARRQETLGENRAWSWLPHSFGHDAPP
jgi:hypothetical protein